MKKSIFYVFMLTVMSVISVPASAFSSNPKNVPVSKVPAYYPGDGINIKFSEGKLFTFLWPEKWSRRSALTFVLVAKHDNQTAEEAITANQPLYTENNITSYYVQYPLDGQPLRNGEYAWRLTNEGGKVLLTTTFRIDSVRSDPYAIIQSETTCMYLKERQDGGYQVAYDGILCLHFTEPYTVVPNQKLRFCIYDSHRNIVLRTDDQGLVVEPTTCSIISPSIHTGENWVRFNVGGICCYYDDGTHDYKDDYYLEVWDSKGEKSFLRFRCIHSMPRLVIMSNNS